MPESPPAVGLSAVEVAFLIRTAAVPMRQQICRALGMDPTLLTDQTVAFGLSSLVARGWAKTVGEEDVELSGPALLAGYCLAEARRWTQIAFLDPGGAAAVLYFQAPEVSVLVQPQQAGTWIAMFKPAGSRDGEIIRVTLEAAASAAPDSSAIFTTVTADSHRSFAVRRTSENLWTYALGSDDPAAPGHKVDPSELMTLFDTLLDLPGHPPSETA